MTAVAKFVTDAKDLIEKVFLKTSFLIVLVSLFLISQCVDGEIKYLPFIKHFHPQNPPNQYTTYTVTIAMLLLLSRGLSWVWDWIKKGNKFYHDYEIKKLQKKHTKEIVEISERNDKLSEQLKDAKTVIHSLCEPSQNAWDFLCDIADKKSFTAFYLHDFCYITYTDCNNFRHTIAKISHIRNNSKHFNMKTYISIKQILEEHKNNKETLTYEPPHRLTNNR